MRWWRTRRLNRRLMRREMCRRVRHHRVRLVRASWRLWHHYLLLWSPRRRVMRAGRRQRRLWSHSERRRRRPLCAIWPSRAATHGMRRRRIRRRRIRRIRRRRIRRQMGRHTLMHKRGSLSGRIRRSLPSRSGGSFGGRRRRCGRGGGSAWSRGGGSAWRGHRRCGSGGRGGRILEIHSSRHSPPSGSLGRSRLLTCLLTRLLTRLLTPLGHLPRRRLEDDETSRLLGGCHVECGELDQRASAERALTQRLADAHLERHLDISRLIGPLQWSLHVQAEPAEPKLCVPAQLVTQERSFTRISRGRFHPTRRRRGPMRPLAVLRPRRSRGGGLL